MRLCKGVSHLYEAEPRCVFMQSPVYVFGDIHGNLEVGAVANRLEVKGEGDLMFSAFLLGIASANAICGGCFHICLTHVSSEVQHLCRWK